MSVKLRKSSERNLMNNLNREIGKIEGDISRGLKAAMIFIIGEAIEITPKEHGVLRGSAFNSVEGQKARVGFTAIYAPFVHEMPTTNNFTTPDTGPKFLQRAIFENTKTIINIIKRRAQR